MANPIQYPVSVFYDVLPAVDQKAFDAVDVERTELQAKLKALDAKQVAIILKYAGRYNIPEVAYTGGLTDKGNPAKAKTGAKIVMPSKGETMKGGFSKFGLQFWSEPAGFEGFTWAKAKSNGKGLKSELI